MGLASMPVSTTIGDSVSRVEDELRFVLLDGFSHSCDG
jgi:hypothetical protein